MEKKFKGNANKGGVYQIRNLANQKIYIGSAKSFKQRASQHEARLNQGKHHNKHLLASWNKYGSDNFLFEILEVVEGTAEKRRQCEQKYLNTFLNRWSECYNLHKKTILKKQQSFSKTPEETSKLRSKISKKRWENPEYRNQRSIATKQLWNAIEFRKKIMAAQSNSWTEEKRRTASVQKKELHKTEKGKRLRQKSGQATQVRWQNEQYRQRVSTKISQAKKTQWQNEHYKQIFAKAIAQACAKKVNQVDIKTNETLATFISLQEAMQQTGINFRYISAVCTGRQKTAGGYKWKFVE